MPDQPFVVDPELSAVAIAYSNAEYIADAVLPRVGVGTKTFKYSVYNREDRFTIPNTLVGRRSRPNEVEFGSTELEATASDRGLDDPVPQDDIDQANRNWDPLGNAVEGISELIMLDREKRTADLVFDANTYPAGNKIQLAGNDRWAVEHTDSDPIEDIEQALDTPLMRPNTMVLGRKTWRILRKHPRIVKAKHGNSGDSGLAMMRDIAELFELERVLVGSAWHNSAKPGQAPQFVRLWGEHCALLRVDPTANTRRGVTFGLTGQYGDRVAWQRPDPDIGLRGGTRVRAGESVVELIVASDVGYFIQDAGNDA